MKTFACGAGYGSGGLGQHLAALVEDARAHGDLARYYTTRARSGDDAGNSVRQALAPRLSRWTPIRFSPPRQALLGFDLFDRAVARAIEPAEEHVGFSLQSLRTFRSVRAKGCEHLALVSPTCHVDKVRRQYENAFRAHPIERSWLGDGLHRKAVREYDEADVIVIASDYVRQSLLDSGIPSEKLVRFDLEAAPRFVPPDSKPDDGVFRVVYTGALSVAKGVPVLLDAFASFSEPSAELTLVGGAGTRQMRRFLEARCACDPRIRVEPGDPLPHLQRADVYVHPSHQDGSPYAPLEALACGVPVILTEDTGTKELIEPGVNGLVVPTGRSDAIVEALEAFQSRPVTSTVVR